MSPDSSAKAPDLEARIAELEEQLANYRQIERSLIAARRRWHDVVDNAAEVVLLLDRDGMILSLHIDGDDTMEREVVGAISYQYVNPDHHAEMRTAIEGVFRTGQPGYYEVQEAGGEGRWFGARVAPILRENRVDSVAAICTDITERKSQEEALRAAERSLRQANDLLEQRVAERTSELQRLNESLRGERRLLKRLLDLHDRDRQLIAYEIHDGMVQDMTGAVMRMEAALSSFPGDEDHPARKNVAKSIRLVQKGIEEARRLINGLRPPVLEAEGLVPAIINLAEENRLNGDLAVDLHCDVQFNRIAPALETAIYRIVQEGLNNVRKHSQANQARVSLVQTGQRVRIEVQDRGVGFDSKAVKGQRHGLEGIRERARLLEGEFDIASKPGEGTTLVVVLPLTDVLLPDAAEL